MEFAVFLHLVQQQRRGRASHAAGALDLQRQKTLSLSTNRNSLSSATETSRFLPTWRLFASQEERLVSFTG